MAGEKNGHSWALAMAIMAGVGAVALFLSGLGYGSVERRLCSIEAKIDSQSERLVKVEERQNARLDRERLEGVKVIR